MKKNIWYDVLSNGPVCVAGPCAVESYSMMERIAHFLKQHGVRILRAGAFKPRSSAKSFQGLGEEGLAILSDIGKKYDMQVASEITDLKYLEIMLKHIDILQVGARSMYHYEMLKELGKIRIPVLLKRGMSATIKEFLSAAEYITQGGNENVLLCERGIRSFDTCTRNLLDLSCVAIIKCETEFPIIVDISHALGRKDIAPQMAKAALSAGADGIMVEVHEHPQAALSDAAQQMNFSDFDKFYTQVMPEMRMRDYG